LRRSTPLAWSATASARRGTPPARPRAQP
jgi:hypothetical protein